MKKSLLKIVVLLCVGSSYLYSNTHRFTIENDGFVSKDDSYYTGGVFYTWMGDQDNSLDLNFMNDLKTNNAISYTQLVFTPKDKDKTTRTLNDTPYAGYAKLNFLLYKSTHNYFHEFGMNIGAVGPMVKSKQLQSGIHDLIGHDKPAGWDNQLANQVTAGISYNFAKKTDKIDIGQFKFDWTNNVKIDLGNFYSGVMVSSTVRIGSNFPNTFATTGSFMGADESSLVNYDGIKSFNWAVSLGLYANKIANYYIIDEARDQGYDIPNANYITGEQVSYDIFYNNIQYTFKITSTYLHNNKAFSSANKQWGGLTIVWKF